MFLRVLPVSATAVDCQLLGMGATAVSNKPTRTGTLSFPDSAIVASVFRITGILLPPLIQVCHPIKGFKSCNVLDIDG